MHLKNDKKCTIHTDWGGYIHLLGRWGAYIIEMAGNPYGLPSHRRRLCAWWTALRD